MVTKLRYGNTNTFLIRGSSGALLLDTDYAGTLQGFYRAIKAENVTVRDITHILVTHWHPDHMGLVSLLMKQGIKLVLPDVQLAHVHFSDSIFARDKHLQYEPVSADDALVISLGEGREFLKSLGINGELLSTPSHSADSVSLVLDSGECFVGDLEPAEYLSAYGSNGQLEKDWELILSRCPKEINYAHFNKKIL